MIPLEVVTGLGSFVVGAAVRLMVLKMQMKHQEQKALMEQAGIVAEAREHGIKDPRFSFTRRIIALTLTGVVTAPMWMPFIGDLLGIPVAVAIPAVNEESTKVLFGLFSASEQITEYKHITTATYLPEYKHYFSAVMGLYFGAKVR